jgi:hydrogenase maturation protease
MKAIEEHPVWRTRLLEALAGVRDRVDLVGVGNQLRGDDGFGPEVISELRTRLGESPPGLRIHQVSATPERLLSKLASRAERILVFDAVEAEKSPGEIVCSKLSDTKYGYFATHNIPLRLVPGLADREEDFYIVGVQPESLEVGEGLTPRVRASVREIVAVIANEVEASK